MATAQPMANDGDATPTDEASTGSRDSYAIELQMSAKTVAIAIAATKFWFEHRHCSFYVLVRERGRERKRETERAVEIEECPDEREKAAPMEEGFGGGGRSSGKEVESFRGGVGGGAGGGSGGGAAGFGEGFKKNN